MRLEFRVSYEVYFED